MNTSYKRDLKSLNFKTLVSGDYGAIVVRTLVSWSEMPWGPQILRSWQLVALICFVSTLSSNILKRSFGVLPQAWIAGLNISGAEWQRNVSKYFFLFLWCVVMLWSHDWGYLFSVKNPLKAIFVKKEFVESWRIGFDENKEDFINLEIHKFVGKIVFSSDPQNHNCSCFTKKSIDQTNPTLN